MIGIFPKFSFRQYDRLAPLLGLTLMDFFTDSCYEVELEKDMTLQEQFLDVVILRKSSGKAPPPLPDGLENLSEYN